MGCPCGCQDEQLQFDFDPDFEPDPAQDAFEAAVEAITVAMNVAFEEGLRQGAKAVVDVSQVEVPTTELEDLVEADAVALDSVLAQVQDLMMRLESLEMHLGLKYTP